MNFSCLISIALLYCLKSIHSIEHLMAVSAWQTGVNYYMPVRCMELDALSYSHQCRSISEEAKESGKLKKYSDGVPKGTKIVPVVTLVFYVGREPWDGPVSVYDMLDIPDDRKEWMRKTIPDYRMNLIDARHMKDEELDRFHGDLKAFLMLLGGRFDRERLKSVVAMHRETWYALSAIKNALDRYMAEESAKKVAKGEAKVNKLGLLLTEAGRTADFLRSLSDRDFQHKLFVEFGLEEKK